MKYLIATLTISAICLSSVLGQRPQQLHVDLSLEDAIRLSQDNGSQVAQASLQAMISKGAITSADGDFDPVLFSSLNYDFNESASSGFFSSYGDTTSRSYSATQGIRSNLRSGGNLELRLNEGYDSESFLTDTQSNTSMSLSFTQPLLRGAFSMVATANERKAYIAHDSDLLSLTQVGVDSVQSVVDAYWNLSFARADLEVKKQSLVLAENLRDITIAKYDVGAVAKVEVTQTRADIASRQDAVLIAQNSVDTNHDALRRLISTFDNQDDWQINFNLVSASPPATAVTNDWQDLWNNALENRGDIQKLQLDVDSAQIDFEVAQSNMSPKLDFIATGTYSAQDHQVGSSLDRLLDHDYPGYTLGFVFELPISNSSYVGAKIQAKNRLLLAKRILRDQGADLAQQVRQALHNVNYYSERVAVTAHASNMAQLKLESEQLRLREGASTNYQVLQFQADLAVAQSQQLQTQTEYAKASVKLDTVQGNVPTF
ncbi:MAG: TolC family protein [Planctomycetota bacterium]|nr:TolC family protein [Planctomycetota bacterium]